MGPLGFTYAIPYSHPDTDGSGMAQGYYIVMQPPKTITVIRNGSKRVINVTDQLPTDQLPGATEPVTAPAKSKKRGRPRKPE